MFGTEGEAEDVGIEMERTGVVGRNNGDVVEAAEENLLLPKPEVKIFLNCRMPSMKVFESLSHSFNKGGDCDAGLRRNNFSKT